MISNHLKKFLMKFWETLSDVKGLKVSEAEKGAVESSHDSEIVVMESLLIDVSGRYLKVLQRSKFPQVSHLEILTLLKGGQKMGG